MKSLIEEIEELIIKHNHACSYRSSAHERIELAKRFIKAVKDNIVDKVSSVANASSFAEGQNLYFYDKGWNAYRQEMLKILEEADSELMDQIDSLS